MQPIEEYIAYQLVTKQFSQNITDVEVVGENLQHPWLKFKLVECKIGGKYKTKIKKYLWDKLETVWLTYVGCKLITEGYLVFPLEGGWIVISPQGEEYQIENNQCSCQSKDLYKGKCKHMLLRDFILSFQFRANKAKFEKYGK